MNVHKMTALAIERRWDGDPIRPMHNHRSRDAALELALFIPLKRRITSLCPGSRIAPI